MSPPITELVAGIVLSSDPCEAMSAFRRQSGVSQSQLAREMNVSCSTLADYEKKRRRNPGADFIRKWCICMHACREQPCPVLSD
ncbi:MAG: helix-turn-helix domain-containing protein [Candidatus Diapherotrites archaeon]|nr:helix-turn-helix domain-containing protein [Candidatus Diapherotrites archaeon]